MEKDFWKLKNDSKKLCVIIICAGALIGVGMTWNAYKACLLQNGSELPKNEAGAGTYEQKLFAHIDGIEKVPLTVVVEERRLTEKEADELFSQAILILEEIVKGENESFQKITKNLKFVDVIPQIPVEITWTTGYSEYFYSDGVLKEEVEISEPVEVRISAIMSCQEYTRDYEKMITIFPKEKTIARELEALVAQSILESEKKSVVILPETYDGKEICWKKPVDSNIYYFPLLLLGAIAGVKIGSKRDEYQEKKSRLEQLEREYPQIVSKFSMLLSAGVSVRNAWERIVRMEQRKPGKPKLIYDEMNWALREMQKGISELEVYEAFSAKTGQIHYKKLMALFVSHKRRGGGNLLESMNQEMLQAWEERKRKTKQQGEMIGTKLLLPMMGMLGIVFVMILVPAFLSF